MVTLLTVVLIPKHLTDQQKVHGLVQKNVTSHLFSYDVYIVLMATATVILISVFFIIEMMEHLKLCQKIIHSHLCVLTTEKEFCAAIVLQLMILITVWCLVLENADNVVTGGCGH